jgi:hypothetical protein
LTGNVDADVGAICGVKTVLVPVVIEIVLVEFADSMAAVDLTV